MKAGELVTRVKKPLARKNRIRCRFVAAHGKGSHGTLYFAGRLTDIR
ncbi:MAG: hypothetical protein AAB225_18145 [Acidobacteriota bacterium]